MANYKKTGAGAKLNATEAKQELKKLLYQGMSVKDGLLQIGRSVRTYEEWRKRDKEFADEVTRIRGVLKDKKNGLYDNTPVPDFPEFCETYLGNKLFAHQLQWFDMLEGRPPRDLHPAMTYEAGRESRMIVNTPPGHAKSTTITVNYVIWRLMKNPDLKVIIVSKAQRLSEQFLLQIKERLTNPQYSKLQETFGPPGGWQEGSASWKQSQFYISGRSAEAKDPSVQAVGIRGQVYGARADLVIVDDAIDNTNVGEYEKQIDWLLGIVASRLAPRTGRLLVVGTRISAKDLYSELRNPERYYGQSQPWTYLLQPAVLEFDDDPKKWNTLWAYSDSPADPDEEPNEEGLYRRWDGETLKDLRDGIAPALWSRIYQQEQIAENSVFEPESVSRACQARQTGMIPDDANIGREGGMDGLYIIAGLDPASTGYTAAVVLGVDLQTGKRHIIDISNRAGSKPDETRDLIKEWTERYGVKEWRIERNAFQTFLTRDTEINEYLASRGVVLTEHMTNNNKHDPNFGVMAMSALFTQNLITLPRSDIQRVKTLIEQLVTWQPNPPKGLKTDVVMALWFAELRALEMVSRAERKNYFRNSPFMTRQDMQDRVLVGSQDTAPYRSFWGGNF
jgi:hypothetical protein